ncbi:hypothetical protein HZC09_06425, partial [Candidatus Micrarchaeota archaeon]|nr:hypothetical protein [Candidatus Micrarchaeota archaeon]
SNRVIIAYPSAYVPSFRKEFEPFLAQLARETDVLFLSGLHILNPKNYKKTTDELFKQLSKMRKANRNLRIHYEYVPADDASVEKNLLLSLSKSVDSLGLNEVELGMVLSNLGFKKEEKELLKRESAETLYYGALAIMRKLKLRRVHVHCLGYNILVLPKTENAEKARDGALFGAVAASIKSQEGELDAEVLKKEWKLRISEAGYNQIGVFESTIWDAFQKRKHKPISALLRKKFMSSGVFEEKDHFAIIVPAPIASGVKTTVGLGDVVSACAYAYENLK